METWSQLSLRICPHPCENSLCWKMKSFSYSGCNWPGCDLSPVPVAEKMRAWETSSRLGVPSKALKLE